jgi:hypothetical protein
MNEVTINELTHNGIRRVKIIGDVVIDAARYEHLIPLVARDLVVYTPGCDELLGIFQLEITWPVYGPYEVFYHGPKKFRRFMFVNFAYSERVSNCMEMARDEFFARTHFAPRDVYVKELPTGAEMWMDVHGCILQVAGWMPAQCVAVGGRDV